MSPQSKLPASSESEDDDVELPQFTVLQQLSGGSCPLVVLDSSDSDTPYSSSPDCATQEQSRTILSEKVITMINTDSEEEEEIVSLAERLKGRFLASSSGSSQSMPQKPSTEDFVSNAGRVRLGTDQKAQFSVKAQQAGEATAVSSARPLDSDQDNITWLSKQEPLPMTPLWQLEPPGSTADIQKAEVDPAGPPPPKKVKWRRQEMEQTQQPVQRRRRAQEGLQADKEKQCWEQEKARKAALARAVKAQRPEECLKYIQVLIDPALLQSEGGGQLLSALQAMESSCLIEKQPIPYSICWRRRTAASQVEEDPWLEEPNVVVLVPRGEFESMIHSSRQNVCSDATGAQTSLRRFVENIVMKSAGKTISLAVVEMEKYFGTQKLRLRKTVLNGDAGNAEEKRRRRKRNEEAFPVLSRMDVEKTLVDLQLYTGVQVQFLETWKEFADFISMFTKAVAETPFKHERDKTGFSFFLESDWAGGVKVDRSGKGLLQVWKRQIQQLNRVSVDIANAVVSNYPSPQLLVQAYRHCGSEYERQHLLADVHVRRGEGVTSTSRRVGPELSKRIYLQMTSDLPELLLEVNP
ncbi:crossover junction endonuclease EME1 [Rhinatrema bivittatum]|uniref:crossover junction endonuclease EME1 n=1 Tax=Rhinatrema bivittatum TaxID=194408 RepID=UPI0011277EE3|nr:crossover junction endonuclease EME1 [Rhinatrema bivittatum]XP_029456481.1 crossover junction endonuclease EME1 [Rhinatrema bivittatum]